MERQSCALKSIFHRPSALTSPYFTRAIGMRQSGRVERERRDYSSPSEGRSVQSGQVIVGRNDRGRLAPASTALRIVAYILIFGLIWEAATVLLQPPDYLLPPLHGVLIYFSDQWRMLIKHAGVTAHESLLGFGAAVVGGIAVAFILDRFPRIAMILWPSVLFAQITPKVAIAPLLLLWLGFGIGSKVVIAFLISFFPILVNAHAGFRSIDQETAELARSMGVGGLRYFFRFQFPHALPRIFSGARIAINFALVGAVVGEFVGSDQGLGNLIILAARLLNSPLMFSTIILLMGMGALFFFSVGLSERWMIPWHVSYRRAVQGGATRIGLQDA
jgi:NitT/TauT family transport system permease protein